MNQRGVEGLLKTPLLEEFLGVRRRRRQIGLENKQGQNKNARVPARVLVQGEILRRQMGKTNTPGTGEGERGHVLWSRQLCHVLLSSHQV